LDEKLQKEAIQGQGGVGRNFFIGLEKKNNNSLGRMRIAPYAFHREFGCTFLEKTFDPHAIWTYFLDQVVQRKKSRLRQVLQGETRRGVGI
jgi:hypothetical protein